MDAASLIEKSGVLAEYVELGTEEPRSEAVRQETARKEGLERNV